MNRFQNLAVKCIVFFFWEIVQTASLFPRSSLPWDFRPGVSADPCRLCPLGQLVAEDKTVVWLCPATVFTCPGLAAVPEEDCISLVVSPEPSS